MRHLKFGKGIVSAVLSFVLWKILWGKQQCRGGQQTFKEKHPFLHVCMYVSL